MFSVEGSGADVQILNLPPKISVGGQFLCFSKILKAVENNTTDLNWCVLK
jgi:hypothetical protein